MPTNILQLPQIDGSQTSLAIVRNADWVDSLSFSTPGSLPTVTLTGCTTSGGSDTITVPPNNNLLTGMPINVAPSVPFGAFVGPLLSSTSFQMVNFLGTSLSALITDPAAVLTFLALPLDITGIGFISSVGQSSSRVLLTAKTSDGSMVNGGTTGVLSYNVNASKLGGVPAGNYVVDILAIADGHTVNLFSKPAPITVTDGVASGAFFP